MVENYWRVAFSFWLLALAFSQGPIANFSLHLEDICITFIALMNCTKITS